MKISFTEFLEQVADFHQELHKYLSTLEVTNTFLLYQSHNVFGTVANMVVELVEETAPKDVEREAATLKALFPLVTFSKTPAEGMYYSISQQYYYHPSAIVYYEHYAERVATLTAATIHLLQFANQYKTVLGSNYGELVQQCVNNICAADEALLNYNTFYGHPFKRVINFSTIGRESDSQLRIFDYFKNTYLRGVGEEKRLTGKESGHL